MRTTLAAILGTTAVTLACGSGEPTGTALYGRAPELALAPQGADAGLVRKRIPDEDPGPPFYARATTILNQLFHDDEWLVIPFYRDPSCVPDEFNLLQLFDFPGPAGPGAFACELLMTGFLLTEADAPPTAFPLMVQLTGDAVPFWFVPWEGFQSVAADGIVTIGELLALDPIPGTAREYHETLKPREGDHLIVIDARGDLDDGRRFRFHLTHVGEQTPSLVIGVW